MITAGINAYAYVGAVQVGGAGPATSSAHFKAGTAPYGWIDDTTQNVRAVFNVTTGAFTGWEGTPTTHVFRSTVLPNGWIRASLSWVTAVTIQTQMGLSAAPASGVALAGQTIYMWGAQVEQSAVAGSYIPTTTAAVTNPVVTAGVGAAIPAASLLGYTAENIVTNLQIQSQQFDLWANTEATVTANVLMAPDGSLTADMLTDNAQNNVHRVFNSSNQTAAVYTSSVYVKKGTLPWVQLFAQIGVGFGANFNLTTGAIGIVTAGATAAVQVLPNGWFRFSITYTAVAAVGNFHILASLTDANIIGPTYVGTGQTMYLWGAQVELGDLSSYIPTTTATVFRSYDQLTYQKAGNYDGAIGSAYAECYLPTAQVGQQNVVLFTGAGYPLYFEPSVHALAIYSGPVVAGLNTRIVGATNKSASGWSGATCSVVLNGGAPGTGAYTAIPLSTGIVGVGHINAGVQIIQGSIRNLKLYPTRLTDAQLQALTA
jgi:hypothetical protein